MATLFNKARRNREPQSEWGERVADAQIGTLLEYELGARSLRSHMFDPHVINDSSWTLVQDLFAAHLKGVKMRTKELCATSGLPQTTVLRYLDHLEKLDMVRRETDPDDSRVTLIVMTDWGALWLREYYSQVFASQKRLATKGQGLFSLDATVAGKALGDV
jgi:DNA-binding MarR family transcriptional regulator